MKNIGKIVILALACFSLLFSEVKASSSKCYVCLGTCADPIQVANCAENDEDKAEYRCFINQATIGGVDIDNRGCTPETGAELTCSTLTASVPGSTCNYCDGDLCNNKAPGVYLMSCMLISSLVLLLTRLV